MIESLRVLVHGRAEHRCEYCHLPQAGHEERFSIDHVIPRQHVEDNSADNLALSCLRCNLHKGTNLSGLDPSDRAIVTLFNPRLQQWANHFQWTGPVLNGLTSVGRTTVATLRMNSPERIRLRQILLDEGTL